MSVLAFEDIHEYKWDGYYATPNEDTMAWRELLKGTPIYRAAGICSSGEVGLFGILPLVRRELVLIDHSYKSLHVAAVKWLLLKERGAKETHRLCTTGTFAELLAATKAMVPTLPIELKECFPEGAWLQPRETPRYYGVSHSYPHTTAYAGSSGGTYDHHKVQDEWHKLSLRVVEKAVQKLDRVKFIHGDLSDLVSEGPFGLLYLSNALSHEGRNNKNNGYTYYNQLRKEIMEQIEAIVKPGGYVVLATSGGYGYGYDTETGVFAKRGWELLNKIKGGSWSQQLWRVAA